MITFLLTAVAYVIIFPFWALIKGTCAAIDAAENSKIVFEVKNNGAGTIYDIAPVISVTGSKHIVISPTAVISYIDAGQSIRYSAEVYADRKLRDGIADFTISFARGDYLYNMTSFQLATRARRR